MQPSPLRIDKIGPILASRCTRMLFRSIGAARLMGKPFGIIAHIGSIGVKVRGSIFGSKSEARAFKTLLSRWSPNLSLYPSLPLANLLEVEAGELNPKERDFYLKTSVDYTFCELDGRPILSMEFDGLGGGFSRGTEYLQERETPDPYRKLKLDCKLRMANQVGYPLIVISSDEMEPVDNDERLTILDGIVGAFLSSQDTPRRLDEMLREKRSELEGLHPEVAHSLLQDLVLHAETDAEFANDLFVKRGALHGKMLPRRKSLL